MSSLRTTRKLLSAYAEREPWKQEFDEVQLCLDVEEKIAWGIHLFRGLTELEARAMAHSLQKPDAHVEQLLEATPLFYQLWVEVSEKYLTMAEELVVEGYRVEGLQEFRETLEEARCLVGNLEIEDELRPIEELTKQASPENPCPERYGNELNSLR